MALVFAFATAALVVQPVSQPSLRATQPVAQQSLYFAQRSLPRALPLAAKEADEPLGWLQERLPANLKERLPADLMGLAANLKGPSPLLAKAAALDFNLVLASPQILAQGIFLSIVTVEALQFAVVAMGSYLVTGPVLPSARLGAAVSFATSSRGATRFIRALAELYALPPSLRALFSYKSEPARDAAFIVSLLRALAPPLAAVGAMRLLDASVLAHSSTAPLVGLACLLFDRDGDGLVEFSEAITTLEEWMRAAWAAGLSAWAAGGPLREYIAALNLDDRLLALCRAMLARGEDVARVLLVRVRGVL